MRTRSLTTALLGLAVVTPLAARADQIKALNRGDQNLSAFYLAIQGAQQSIDVATYVIEPCQSAPKFLLNALAEKAKKGVKVRFVIEAWNMKEPVKSNLPAWLASQSDKNFEIRYYGSASILQGDRPRSHIKAFIVDGGRGNASQIVGGRNWTDEYFGLNTKVNYVDQDLLVVGSSASNARIFFDELWKNSATAAGFSRAVKGQPADATATSWAQGCLASSGRDTQVAQYVRSNAKSILSSRPTRSCGDTYYVADDPSFMATAGSPEGGPTAEILSIDRLQKKHSTGLWLQFLMGTVKKVAMVNQYYMPWARVKTALESLRTAKKSIEVIANATGDIENSPGQNRSFTCWMQSSAYQTYLGTQHVDLLTSRGALRDSWAMSQGGLWRIHAKTGIRDDADVLVGSWNMDPRSYATNLEDGVLVTACPALASDVNQQYDQLRATVKADKFCPACDADFDRSFLSDSASCGGNPTFY